MIRNPIAPSRAVRAAAIPLSGNASDYDALLEQVGERSFVLLGEATHGTSEFYRMRAEITRRLIEEKHFDTVAVEADWPDAYRLNRYVRGDSRTSIRDAFKEFQRFPRWMWRNQEVSDFVSWLRSFNANQIDANQAGFYGLDIYSLYRSVDAVVDYLEKVDPEQAHIARQAYGCLDSVRDPQHYGYQVAFHLRPSCHETVLKQFMELRRRSSENLARDELNRYDEQFYAEQNAYVVLNAEMYYRSLFSSRVNTWNLRDEHMTTTLFNLQRYLRTRGGKGKIVVWAHNSHIGDSRATEMGWGGEHNLGQLVRMRAGQDDVMLVGFTTYAGSVSAASRWDGPVEHFRLLPALPESYESLFHDTGIERFYLPLHVTAAQPLHDVMQQRAVGVVYRPATERASHYYRACLTSQYDALFHVDETSAVIPLDEEQQSLRQETPETYPFGV